MTEVEFNKYLPPYRSLLTPDAQYDYKTHLLVQLSQLELKTIVSRYQPHEPSTTKASIRMKYKSLLSDVSRRALLLSMKVQSGILPPQPHTLKATQVLWKRCKSFSQLPVEIQIYVFSYVDDLESYRSCLYTSKRFYQLAKPFLYHRISFTSTYRFAQFVTHLRINSTVGSHVYEIDLSQLKPGNWELEEAQHEEELHNDENMDPEDHDLFINSTAILAGWRDWKFKNNPLYALHPAPPLTKVVSNTSLNSLPSHKKTKLSKYFKKRRRTHSHSHSTPRNQALSGNTLNTTNGCHPRMNKFLMGYSGSKDVPIGSIIHLINLCPNLHSLNLGNLSLSTDYRILHSMAHKYQHFDLIHNYHKDLAKIIDAIAPTSIQTLNNPFNNFEPSIRSSNLDIASSASSVFSINTFSKPIWKYNSLLPPLPGPVKDILYMSNGDGKIYLSDLNLKSIKNAHLELINESEIFHCLARRAEKLSYINLSSMIWINVKLVKEFLMKMLAEDLEHKMIGAKDYLLFRGRYFDIAESLAEEEDDNWEQVPARSRSLVIDLSDSGMYKNLLWAQLIDSRTRHGQKLIHRIINDELVSSFEEYIIRERVRRGRIGENYFA